MLLQMLSFLLLFPSSFSLIANPQKDIVLHLDKRGNPCKSENDRWIGGARLVLQVQLFSDASDIFDKSHDIPHVGVRRGRMLCVGFFL
jgi:hypothetical protein